MTTTLNRPTIPPAALAETRLQQRLHDAPTIALTEKRRTHLRDLHDLATLCNPGQWPDIADDIAHEIVLIETELWARGVTPTPRPM